jgi:hypothetical protein
MQEQIDIEKIALLVEHFKGQKPSAQDIEAKCVELGMNPVVPEILGDYTFQVEQDEKAIVLFNSIIGELSKLQYPKTFTTKALDKENDKINEEVSENIAKIIEENAVDYRFVSTRTDEMADMVSRAIKQAGTIIFNKMSATLRYMAFVKFGSEFNSLHAREYMKEAYENAEEKNKQVDTTKENTSNEEKADDVIAEVNS